MSIEKLKKNYPVKIRWMYFPLHPETPQEGLSLEDLFPGRDLAPMKERMKSLMAEAGLPYGDRSHTFNSRLAQELGKWADTQGSDADIHDLLYKAYFVDGINIGNVNALAKIAGSAGLDIDAALKVLAEREFEFEVDKDWRRSREIGVTGVPTFYSHDLAVVGCQPYETLEKFVQHLIKLQEGEK